ncbi:NAD-dependent epimerase/dehydratase family protein [Verrucomicrobiales bacterium]|nr:NAD-dependent epimerase/dehydratase family protein [Verrucomicrobiales bacterium]
MLTKEVNILYWRTMDTTQVIDNDLTYILDSLGDEFISLSGNRLLLTGGAGFLGYYLVQSIVRWNQIKAKSESQFIELIVYDNFMRGLPKWLAELESEGLLSVKKHDVTEPLPDEMDEVSYIIHAASIASPIYYRKNPIETMDANVNGLRSLLDYFKQRSERGKHVGGLLYFSTSEIYGDPEKKNIPTSETYRGNVSCTGPRACYDESKRYGETLCVNFAQQYNLPIKIARPFNNYGPGLKITDGRALPDFCRNVLNGEDIVMLSDGLPTRTFCYIADAVVGYFKVLVRGHHGESYNIGTETPEISIKQLADMVITTSTNLFNYTGQLIFETSEDKEYLTDNPNRRCPEISKARKHLDYDPKISLEEGLKRSLIWYKGNMEGVDK